MKMLRNIGIVLGLATFIVACNNDSPSNGEWLIPENQVFDGGPGKDGIPSIDDPRFTDVVDGDSYLEENDLVVGLYYNGEARAYPHAILNWHEIINDDIQDLSVAITYCPLTGTAVGWDRMIEGSKTTFGVSGLLYNTNLLPYDRKTNSNWSQMRLDCVNGALIGNRIKTHQLVETTWKTWKEMYPETEVVSSNTGFPRNYLSFPYGDYITNDERLFFPVEFDDSRLPKKDRVLGVIVNGDTKAYEVSKFGETVKAIEDVVGGIPLVIVGSRVNNFMAAFERKMNDGAMLNFTAVENGLPIVLEDNEGNRWDVFGYAQSGPRQGQRLAPAEAYIGYFFAWGAFYNNLELYDQ